MGTASALPMTTIAVAQPASATGTQGAQPVASPTTTPAPKDVSAHAMLARLGELNGTPTSQVVATDVKADVQQTADDDAKAGDPADPKAEKVDDDKNGMESKTVPLTSLIKMRNELTAKFREAKREAAHERAVAQQAAQLLKGEIDRFRQMVASGVKLDPVAEQLRIAQLQLKIPELEAAITAKLDAEDAKAAEEEAKQSHTAVVGEVQADLRAALQANPYVQREELKAACMAEFAAARAEGRKAVPFVVTAARLQQEKIAKLLTEHAVAPGNSPARRPLPQTSRGVIGQAAQVRHPPTPEGMLARLNEILAGG